MTITERRMRTRAVADFVCPECGADAGRPCRRLSTDYTGNRPLWKRGLPGAREVTLT
jgi:predicted RNA-binding Zn-ribbon protein involved in translation (DUF1610 family)